MMDAKYLFERYMKAGYIVYWLNSKRYHISLISATSTKYITLPCYGDYKYAFYEHAADRIVMPFQQ
jgi:hypothetical protein